MLNHISFTTITPMKFMFVSLRNLVMPLTLGLCFGNVAWGKPSIQSIDVSPSPLIAGQNFTITVAASPDVTQAATTADLPDQTRPDLDRLRTGSGGSETQ